MPPSEIVDAGYVFHYDTGAHWRPERVDLIQLGASFGLVVLRSASGERAVYTYALLESDERTTISYRTRGRRIKFRSLGESPPNDRTFERAREAFHSDPHEPKTVEALLKARLSLREVAKLVGLSHERVRQIGAMNGVRKRIESPRVQ